MPARSLLPDLEPVNPDLAARAARCGDWFREIVSALFGALDPDTGMRAIQELFFLVPKKNSKTTNGTGLMLAAVIVNKRPNAEFLIVAPTWEIADLAFSQTLGMVQNDGDLTKHFQVQQHLKRLHFRSTGTTLQIKAFSLDVMTGVKPVGVLVDEQHVITMHNDAGSIVEDPPNALARVTKCAGGFIGWGHSFLILRQSYVTPAIISSKWSGRSRMRDPADPVRGA